MYGNAMQGQPLMHCIWPGVFTIKCPSCITRGGSGDGSGFDAEDCCGELGSGNIGGAEGGEFIVSPAAFGAR